MKRLSPLLAALLLTLAHTGASAELDPQLVERWDTAYRDGRRPSWETGRPSTELKRLVESGPLRPGRVLELGCGTGVNAVYLASAGFDVTAIDLAPTALTLARERARQAGVSVRWLQADVLNPPDLGQFDLVFDRGCYHGVRRLNAARYAQLLAAWCRPGSRALILAGNANEPRHYGPPRVDETDLVNDFASTFDFEQLKEIRFDTADPNAQGALAWSVLLRRQAAPQTDTAR